MPAQTNKRKKSRHRGARSRANADIEAHIASLGLSTLEAYKAWCRDHGFTGATNKTWQERRQERAAAQRAQTAATTHAALEAHLEALGIASVEAYRAWCGEHGLSDGLQKSPRQRQKECELARQLQSAAALQAGRRQTRRRRDTFKAIFSGQLADAELKGEELRLIAAQAQALAAEPAAREAFLQLLLHVEKTEAFFGLEPAVARFGRQPGNTYIEALAALARHCGAWVQPLRAWRPDSHNLRRQFGSLARHLLACYAVPAFMDMAWFEADGEAARHQQAWFVHLGAGGNIRTAGLSVELSVELPVELPVELTKKMAHAFLQAPDHYTVAEALRWGQIVGYGGDEYLVEAVIDTPLGAAFDNEAFWKTVLQFFALTPGLELAQVGPIVDYIQDQKFVPQEIDGQDPRPPQPNFSMKGRSLPKLLAQVERWHALLARERGPSGGEWAPSGIGPLHIEDEEDGQTLLWSIRELRNKKELVAEGRALNHCVASYAPRCQSGKTSIWSLQVANREGAYLRLMTIEVNNKGRSLKQIRGKHNVLPNARYDQRAPRKGLTKDYRHYLGLAAPVLQRWIAEQGLIRRILG